MFDYDKLRGRIKEIKKSETKFAPEVGMSPQSLSSKLNQKTDFTSIEIHKISKALGIEQMEIAKYFFEEKLELNSRNDENEENKKIAAEH